MFRIENYIAQFSDKTIALSVYDLETGREININAHESFHPASTIKVHVMMEVFHQADQGIFPLEEQIPVHNSFTSIVDASPFSLDVKDDSETSLYNLIGQNESVHELTRLMIVRSSNLATNILLEKAGAVNVNSFIESLGIQGVTVRRGVEDNVAFRMGLNNSATARGLTQTMNALAERRVVSKQASD